MPVHVGQAAVDAVVAEGQPGVVDAEQVQDGGVEVVAVGGVLDGLVRPLVAGAVGDAPLDAAAGQPGGEGRTGCGRGPCRPGCTASGRTRWSR